MTKTMLTLLLPFSLLYAELDLINIYNAPPECMLDCPGIDELPLENTVWREEFCDWILEKKQIIALLIA